MKSKETSRNPTDEEGSDEGEKESATNKSDDGSSSESLYEIRLNECVKRSEISDFDLRALVVRCSSCGRQINHYSYKEVKKHRKLGVITCKECYEFYGSSEFSQDESGYNYCTWCGNGGKLIVCDYCPNGFCSACIRRNFGRAEISKTTKEGWKCYCCNRSRLKPKVKFCDLIMSSKMKDLMRKEKKMVATTKTVSSPSFSENWLQAAFNRCDESVKTFSFKSAKLKAVGLAKKKSFKHIIKKMEEVINTHRSELKSVMADMSKDYANYLKEQRSHSQKTVPSEDMITLDGEMDDKKSNSSSVIVEDADKEQQPNNSDYTRSPSVVQPNDNDASNTVMPPNNKIDDKTTHHAKFLLLKSSSESDVEEKFQTSKEENGERNICNGKMFGDDSMESWNNAPPVKSKSKDTTADDNRPDSKNNPKSSALIFSSSSSESESGRPNFDKIVEEVDKQIESDTLGGESNDTVDPELDPKLKLEPKIELFRCDHLLKDGETYVISSDENTDVEDKLDKLIDSLCKFPRNKKTPKIQKGKRSLGRPKATSLKEALLEESSSSISLSSEDEDQKKIEIKKKQPQKDKSDAKADDSSDDSGSSVSPDSDDEDVKVSKKSKPRKKGGESDSSDDFQPTKRKKYDKLLHGPLLSDSDNEKKAKDNNKEKKEKKSVRKRKKGGSSGEESSSTSSSEESNKKTKRRRRIKKMGSSSEEEDGDGSPKQSQDKDGSGKGRKNIRKLVSKSKLEKSTKEAQLEEKERKRRIQERQRLYNKIEDFSVDGKEVITRKMVLEVDPDSKEEVVEIHPDLVCKLKPHQVNGVKFMWECTIESVKELKKPGSGCILAHCMGLGKTLQVIAFLHTCLTNPIVGKRLTRAMIICPYNTVLNWVSEFNFWLEDVEGEVKVHQLSTVKSNFERYEILKYWFEEGGCIILSYDIFRRLSGERVPKLKAKERKELLKCLLDPGPDIVVCDEGHILKNEKSAISVATSKLATRRRIILTGTPLQNNLKEYHCMVSFVKPSLLGTSNEFRNRFVNPIINGQYDDSNMNDVKLMKKRIHILHKLLDGCVQRCDYSALTKFLPPKYEFVISVKLSEVQMKMYECYLEKITTAKADSKISGRSLFTDFTNLRCIWTHPYICHISHKKQEYKKMFKDDVDDDENLKDFIDDNSEPSASGSSSSDEIEKVDLEDNDSGQKTYKTRSRAKEAGSEEESEEGEEDQPWSTQWYSEFISEEDKNNVDLSGKMVLLLQILRECERIGDKVLLFSQSLLALDCIEDILSFESERAVVTPAKDEKDKDILGTWTKGLDYFRMDGTTSVDFRKSYIDMFNDPSNERSRLFLISTRAGSLGTNLIGANRVIIFDTSWNPSHDVQAIFRVYRFGQIKPVYIYRLLAQGTMEEKIYDRQVTKLSLSYRVVDEQQIDRHFSAADLAELYSFDRNSTTQRPTPLVPKDRLLAELLINFKEWIVTYHEHDSLLQSQNEEDLTEEERQAAWTEYENEREGKVPPQTQINIDPTSLANEPDFSQDYEGRRIPDLKSIVDNIFEQLKTQNPEIYKNPLEFKRKLLSSIMAIRQAFQEMHVKILRKKQEFCSRGTVPNALNKYMDELGCILKSTGDYITRLSAAITTDENKIRQEQMANAAAAHAQNIRQQMYRQQFPGTIRAGFQGRPVLVRGWLPGMAGARIQRMNFPNRAAMAQNLQAAFAAQQNNIRRTYSKGTPIERTPIVTEVDDVTPGPTTSSVPPPSNDPNVPKSTVTIEEIT